MGALYKRNTIWWVKYYVNGRPIRESAGTEKETEARRFLKLREGRVASGAPMLPRADRINYDELATDLRRHYQTTGARNLRDADQRLKPLAKFFAGRRVVSISGALAQEYVQSRQAAGLMNGTINRELSILGTMLRHGYANGKVTRLPVIRLLKEAAPRSGFFEEQDYLNVCKHLRPDLQAAITIEYVFGWRCQSEVLALERRQLDLEAGTLRLDPGQTKNDEGRLAYLTADLKSILSAQVDRVHTLEREMHRVIPFLFPHLTGPHKGTRRKDLISLPLVSKTRSIRPRGHKAWDSSFDPPFASLWTRQVAVLERHPPMGCECRREVRPGAVARAD
jgi:integrase